MLRLLGETTPSGDKDRPPKPVLKEGRVDRFLGINFVHCELTETVMAGTNEVTVPVYTKSGMHLGMWNDIQTEIFRDFTLRGVPWASYVLVSMGATRIEENKVYAIESYRA